MEFDDKLIVEEAPPDTSTYREGSTGIKDEQPEEKSSSFSFYEALRTVNLSE